MRKLRRRVWVSAGTVIALAAGAIFAYKGTVDGNDFVCTYDSTFDKGTFRIKRK